MPNITSLDNNTSNFNLVYDSSSKLIGSTVFKATSFGRDLNAFLRAACIDLTSSLGGSLDKFKFVGHAMGIAGAFHIITGLWNTFRATLRILDGRATGDSHTLIEGGLTLCTSLAQTASGGAALLFRPSSLLNAALGAKASGNLKKFTQMLGRNAVAIGGVLYACGGFLSGWKLYNLLKFDWQYGACYTKHSKICFLSEQIFKHEKKIEGIVGSEVIRLMKQYCASPNDTLREEIIDKAKSAWKRNAMIHDLTMISCFFGVITTALSIVVTGGLGAVAVGLLWVFAVIIPITVADGCAYYDDLKNATPGAYDKLFLVVNTALALLAGGIALALTWIFSFGLAPIILTLLIVGLWVGINAITYINILKSEQKQKKLV